MFKKIFCVVIFYSLLLFLARSQTSKMVFPSEELLYEVSFFGVKLGTIRIVTEENEKLDGKVVHRAKAYIDSYSGIPFVDLHAVFTSWFDPSVSFSYKFNSSMKEKDYWLFDQIFFDYKNKSIKIEKFKKNQRYFFKEIVTSKKWNDGLSIFFLAREYTKSKKNVKIPTLMDKDTVYTYINFDGSIQSVEIPSIGYPVRTVHFSGKADWTGIYGLTGYFEGWFSDDEASVPIKAKMNVYIGSINIELIRWNRKGWSPPKV
ncbi:MAG: DUF3108 domain-containing protein [Candidatus Kapaibacteriota bacterium]